MYDIFTSEGFVVSTFRQKIANRNPWYDKMIVRMLSNKWLVRYLNKPEKQDNTFLGVPDFDLQSHPGAGTLESRAMV